MEKRKQKKWQFPSPLNKRWTVILVLSLLSLIIVFVATVHYIGKTQSFTPAAHAAENAVISGSQRATATQTNGASQGITASASSADITVDFGLRQNTAHPIPTTFPGVGGIGIRTALNYDGSYVSQANIRLTKLGDYDYMSQVFPTAASATNASQQNWSNFDQEMALALSYHLQPIVTIANTPPWLQPQNQHPSQMNPCLTYKPPYNPSGVKPMYIVNGQDIGLQTWGKLAALFVAHVDQKFPQAHALFEIWNQPDGSQFLCMPNGDPNSDQDRVTAYTAMFAAAAPLMKQQASKDGVQIKIGGPSLVYALQKHLTMWFSSLLNDPSTYPYIDFITYHRYLSGQGFNGESNSFVANAQDPVLGVAAQYEQIANAVHAGKQPNAASTPIYLDEYSLNPCYPNVCRNDPVYSPLDNGLFLMDLLNSVNDTRSAFGAAKYLPAGVVFYSWNIPLNNLCMFGVVDAKMDCAIQNGSIQPYPDYFPYELLGGTQYLDMTNGGYVANAASAKPAGVYVTGFYTASLDSVAIINATSSNYQTLHVYIQNPGNVSVSQANVYTIAFNASNPGSSISSTHVNLVPVSGGGYMTTVHLPPNTVIGISVAA